MTKRNIANRIDALGDDLGSDGGDHGGGWPFPEGPKRSAAAAAIREVLDPCLVPHSGDVSESERLQARLTALRERHSITDDLTADDVLEANGESPRRVLAGAALRAAGTWTADERETFTEHVDSGDRDAAKGVLIRVGCRQLASGRGGDGGGAIPA